MRSGKLLVSSFVFLILIALSVASAQSATKQARIYIDSKEQFLELQRLHLDIVWTGDNYIEIITNAEKLQQIDNYGFRTEVIYDDLPAFLRSRQPDKLMGAYKTLVEVYAYLDGMIADHPDIITDRQSIGQTIEGRDIWAVKISDNPDIDEDEPEVLYTSAIHAREVITPEVLFYFMDYLTDNYGMDPEVTDLIENRELWFIIIVNPDGYYHNQVLIEGGGDGMWRKNRRDNGDGTMGVDLNRNYGYLWGYDDIGSSPNSIDETYRGTGPFSEPETQVIRDFIIAHEFVITMYYHSYSNLIIWPYGYEVGVYTPDNDIYVQIGDTVNAFNGYDPGPGWTLYPVNGGSDDWGYGEQTLKNKNFSMTMEVGSYADNFWPPEERIDDLVSENLQPNLFLARIADDIYSLRAPEAPELFMPDTVDYAMYNIDWSHDDTVNPAVQYELIELQDYEVIIDPATTYNNWESNGFTLSASRYSSGPTSFYSSTGNRILNTIQTNQHYTVLADDTLKIKTWYSLEVDWDYAYAEISTDGLNFTPLEGNITTETDPHGNNRGHGITGGSGGWVEGLFYLDDYIGQGVLFRFTIDTDDYTYEEGFYVDDIYPIGQYGIETVLSSSLIDTSYTITDQEEGTYYYKVRARDAQNQWSQFSEVAEVYVDTIVSYTCGDLNDDDLINLADILQLISFVYGDPPGEAPDPLISGNIDGVDPINLADILHLISYVYADPPGPDPNCDGVK